MIQRKTLATMLSYLLSPTVFAFYIIVIFVLFPPLTSTQNNTIFVFLLAFLFLCVFPVIAILYSFKKGQIDIWVSNQRQRTPFYLVAITGYIIASFIFYLQNETIFFVLTLAYLGVTTSVTLGNYFTKISSHSAGVAGPLAALSFVYGFISLPLFILLPLVYWARLNLNAHTKLQLTLGMIIGLLVTYSIFYVFLPEIFAFRNIV